VSSHLTHHSYTQPIKTRHVIIISSSLKLKSVHLLKNNKLKIFFLFNSMHFFLQIVHFCAPQNIIYCLQPSHRHRRTNTIEKHPYVGCKNLVARHRYFLFQKILDQNHLFKNKKSNFKNL
jgi:hypothetical protein